MTIRNSNPNTFTYSSECIAYSEFRRTWRAEYKRLSQEIRDLKAWIKTCYANGKHTTASNAQTQLAYARVRAAKSMKTLSDRQAQWKALLEAGHQYRVPTEALSAAE